ncbi:hypothetical protein L596_029892 [Steinernema carpocapsae]|uniref:Uncharacterized protein n=1 Tax=Steinernema carpocapsae TaxID=34508 RepID=A0A4U5LR48_STECR|nr:hypothetical protein L596_029892 [Steinernema carpocapsae]
MTKPLREDDRPSENVFCNNDGGEGGRWPRGWCEVQTNRTNAQRTWSKVQETRAVRLVPERLTKTTIPPPRLSGLVLLKSLWSGASEQREKQRVARAAAERLGTGSGGVAVGKKAATLGHEEEKGVPGLRLKQAINVRLAFGTDEAVPVRLLSLHT